MATSAATTRDQLRSFIDDGNRRFMDAIARADAAGAADVYTEDAHVLPAGSPMVEGKAAIRGFWKAAVEQLGVTKAELTTVHHELLSDDTACELGRFALTLQGAGAEPSVARGKYLVVWKRAGDAYKIHYDMWNSDD